MEPFPLVIGHSAVKADLMRCLESGRLRGSFLLVGPEGVGRRRLALEVAKAAACQAGGERMPCGECGTCHRIGRGTSGDVLVLSRPEGKSKIPIEEVRKLLEEMALAPVESPVRTFVIDGAGDLMEETQNALLKALEEPPADVLILLIAERASEVIPTILSRCRLLQTGELSLEQVAEVLRREGVAPEEVEARARWSNGSPGQALAEDALDLAEVAQAAVERLAAGARRDPMGFQELLAEFVQPGKGESRVQRDRVARLVRLLQRVLRDVLLLREGAQGPLLAGAGRDELGALAQLPAGRVERALDALTAADDDLSRNANVKLLLDGIALELSKHLTPALEPHRG
ncbi:MAG TPA: hypothetical protein DEA08_11035 [Planctomycetes bacterium]|nr:hypothetical protein [Planctomycetota bacterium]